MSQFDYVGMQTFATGLIADAGMPAALRREGSSPVDRDCIVVIYDYAPRPRENKLVLPVERRCLISATPETLAMPPDFEQDKLVVYQPPFTTRIVVDVLRFLAPAKLYSPAGIVVAYEIQVQA